MTERTADTVLRTLREESGSATTVVFSPLFAQTTSISVVVPCYNEAAGLEPLRKALDPVLDRLHREGNVELVLIDDGSADDTYDSLKMLFPSTAVRPVKVIRHDRNQGLSSALRSAANAVTGDVIVTLDADCTYHPEEVFGLLAAMRRTGAHVVTGSPYHPEGGVENVQGWRLALSRGASRLYGAIVPERLYCYTSMFRAYRREWFKPEFITSDHFVGVTEILVRAIFAGARVSEYPVVLRRRVHGASKLKAGRATWEHLKLMARILLDPRVRQSKVV